MEIYLIDFFFTSDIFQTNHKNTLLLTNNARLIDLSTAKSEHSNYQQESNLTSSSSSSAIRLVVSPKDDSDTNTSHSTPFLNKDEIVSLIPKQINIVKPLSSAIKLSNPILISDRSQQSSTQ